MINTTVTAEAETRLEVTPEARAWADFGFAWCDTAGCEAHATMVVEYGNTFRIQAAKCTVHGECVLRLPAGFAAERLVVVAR